MPYVVGYDGYTVETFEYSCEAPGCSRFYTRSYASHGGDLFDVESAVPYCLVHEHELNHDYNHHIHPALSESATRAHEARFNHLIPVAAYSTDPDDLPFD